MKITNEEKFLPQRTKIIGDIIMTLIYSNIEEQTSLKKEPYKTLSEEYKHIQNDFDGQEICLKDFSEKMGFSNGFFTDEFIKNPIIRFSFYKSKLKGIISPMTLIQMEYSFESDDDNYCVIYQKRMKLLRKRIPYIFIPHVSHVEFSTSIEDSFKMTFNVLVENEANILDACYCLINLVIAIFAFEN